MSQATFSTHEVFNQSPPFEDIDLYTVDRPLMDAVSANGGASAQSELSEFGKHWGSAAMAERGRIANENTPKLRTFDSTKDYGDCTANVNLRAPDGSVDMGTGYDCADVKSHTATKSITAAQRRWREKLVQVMARRGFVNYSKEWWHFSLPGTGGQAYDFPIQKRN